jgi:endonuclease/exonuclease/phosphatase family metal-dependent hydrolase
VVRRIPIALAAALVAALAAAPAGAQPLRVMTWNIAGSPFNSRSALRPPVPFALGDVEAVIARNGPAIVALQETCSWQTTALGSELGLTVWHETTVARFTDTRPGSPGTCDYGDALLARTDLTDRVRVDLLDPGTCKADATVATTLPECRVLMGAGIAGIGTATTHVGIDAGQSNELRRIVDAAAATDPAQPALLLGDMNVLPQDTRLAPRLAARGFREVTGIVPGLPCRSAPACRQTFPAGGPFGRPVSRPDMIFTRGLKVVGVHGQADVTVGGRPASDHRALLADLEPAAADGAVVIRPRRLRTVARRGPAASVGLLQAGNLQARLLASPATARALHLRSRVIARDALAVSAAGHVNLALRPVPRARRALATARRAALSIDIRIGVTSLPRVTFVVRP